MTIDQIRALEALAMAAPVAASTIDQAKQFAKILPLLDDGSDEYAALADFINALAFAFKDAIHDRCKP